MRPVAPVAHPFRVRLPLGVLPAPALTCALALLPLWGQPLSGQPHDHGGGATAAAQADPLLTVLLEGPQMVLAHEGFLELDPRQVEALRPLAMAVCAGEVRHAREREEVWGEWQARMEAGGGDGELLPLLDRQAALDRERMRTLLEARRATLALLDGGQRNQLGWLREHWEREAGVMIQGATQPGHRGHPGMQLPIRVPGMVVGGTALVPFCEALHGPAVHISIPPPR